jgi:hypothetical protein
MLAACFNIMHDIITISISTFVTRPPSYQHIVGKLALWYIVDKIIVQYKETSICFPRQIVCRCSQ